jgi:hypothetical protein
LIRSGGHINGRQHCNRLLKSSAVLGAGGANYDDHHGIGILAKFPGSGPMRGYDGPHQSHLAFVNNVNPRILDFKIPDNSR